MKQNNTASVIIFRKENKVALLCRQNTGWYDGHFGLPGGRVDPEESFTHAIVREAQEEVGVKLNVKDFKVVFVGHVKGNGSGINGEDGDIWTNVVFEAHTWEGELINAEPHKSSELAWFSLEDLPENTVPNSRFYLEQIAAGLTYGERGWD